MVCFSYSIACNSAQSEILIAVLSKNNFNGFQEEEKLLIAYTDSEKNMTPELIYQFKLLGITIPSSEIIPDKNWNEMWESKIVPIEINDQVLIKTTFHLVEKKYPIEIIIDPKMSFGTGHHATTHMMIEFMLENKSLFSDSVVFDFGAGTGILSILAEKSGAAEILAIDHEEWAFNNMNENFERNNATKCIAELSSMPPDTDNKFDLILANINRTVILEFFSSIAQILKPDGILFCSGFLTDDEKLITQAAEKLNLNFIDRKFRENWMAIQFKKQTTNS